MNTVTLLSVLLCCFCGNAVDPAVFVDGEIKVLASSFQKSSCGGGYECYILNRDKPVMYAPNFLNASVIQELKSICIDGNRFQQSPVRGRGDIADSATVLHDSTIRTSESCLFAPSAAYRTNPRFLAIRRENSMPALVREVDLTWFVATQAAALIGMEDPQTVEPLQMVRYLSDKAEYKLHHDHGGYYGKTSEWRPWTALVFLSHVTSPIENGAAGGGGYTAFPKLGLQVVPRMGDAIVWKNTLEDGTADPDMVHAGMPPLEGDEKYALNVWFTGNSLAGGNWGNREEL